MNGERGGEAMGVRCTCDGESEVLWVGLRDDSSVWPAQLYWTCFYSSATFVDARTCMHLTPAASVSSI